MHATAKLAVALLSSILLRSVSIVIPVCQETIQTARSDRALGKASVGILSDTTKETHGPEPAPRFLLDRATNNTLPAIYQAAYDKHIIIQILE